MGCSCQEIIREILGELDYDPDLISQIIRVVINHKSKEPNGDKEIECIVDADNLSDTYQESFYSDVISYNSKPSQTLEFRSKNKFFTKTAKEIFTTHLKDRKSEIESGEAEHLLNKVGN